MKDYTLLEKTLLVVIFSALLGQIYVNPFGSEFRFTLAIVIFPLLLLRFKDLNIISLSVLLGTSMFAIRTSILSVSANQFIYIEAIEKYLPVFMFYILYGILFKGFKVREKVAQPILLFISLWICDTVSNLSEVFLRSEFSTINFEKVLLSLIIVAIIRAVVITFVYYLFEDYNRRMEAKINKQNFLKQIILKSSLNTELFFLKKSKDDIEKAMKDSFQIYSSLSDNQSKARMLSVTNEIHEIKKDYIRVITGMEKSIEFVEAYQMNIDEIVDIVKVNNEKIIEKQGKEIKIRTKLSYRFTTEQYLLLISILNNLVINSIDSINKYGSIIIDFLDEDDYITLRVTDDGEGIKQKFLETVFKPGFSTKYNECTGVMSSGVGLSHVKYILETKLRGEIMIESTYQEGSVVIVKMLKDLVLYSKN